MQLGGNVMFLRGLSFLECFVPAWKVRARVLLIGIQKETVEPTVEIIMVRDVSTRGQKSVVLVQSSNEPAECIVPAQHGMRNTGLKVQHEEVEEAVNAASLGLQVAPHVRFAEP